MKRLVVLGAGESGIGTALLGKKKGYEVFVSDFGKIKENYNSEIQIEVETTTLDQVKEAIDANVNMIMLDNMTIGNIKEAVRIINGRARIEVSGAISIDKLAILSKLDIDFVSIGALTHSFKACDISMNFL